MADLTTFNVQYGAVGGADDNSLSSIGMASSATKDNIMTSAELNNTLTNPSTNNNSFVNNTNTTDEEDAVTAEAENVVTKERQMSYKENAAKLQSILENIKNSTKSILREMDSYLKETEEVEKTFIRCRANTQKESQRMEQVQPDVLAATQRFMAQGAALFGGAAGGANFMSMMGGGVEGSMQQQQSNASAPNDMMAGQVTPRGNDGNASITGSSMAGSLG